jgi:integrase/recombinase XerD
MRENGLSPGGCNNYIRGINSFISWLKDEGHIPERLKIKLLPNPSKPLQGFSDIEIRSLLSFRPKGFTELRTWTLIITLLDTGVRIEEALTLRTSDVDMDATTIKVVGKGNKQRVVPFSFELRKNIFKYQVLKAKQGIRAIYVLCTHSGARLSYRNCYRDIKILCAKTGVVGEHVHPHSMRHFFSVNYIRNGGDIYRLSRILGHTSISTTQLYLRSMGIEQIGENHSALSPLSKLGRLR